MKRSFLEFGSIDSKTQEKEIWDKRSDNQAYDWFMLSRYANDIHLYHKLKQGQLNLYKEIHHADDIALNLRKLIAVKIIEENIKKENIIFFELGQTLFGCIEGMEFSNKLLNINADLYSISWIGVDISEIFNYLAKKMHEKYNVETYNNIKKIKNAPDIFFAKGITLLYACDNIKSFFPLINNSRISIFDYSIFLDKEVSFTMGTGYAVTYFYINDFIREYKKENKKLFINSKRSKIQNKKLTFEAIFIEESLIKTFMLKENIYKNNINNLKLNDMFQSEKESRWVEFIDYIEEQELI